MVITVEKMVEDLKDVYGRHKESQAAGKKSLKLPYRLYLGSLGNRMSDSEVKETLHALRSHAQQRRACIDVEGEERKAYFRADDFDILAQAAGTERDWNKTLRDAEAKEATVREVRTPVKSKAASEWIRFRYLDPAYLSNASARRYDSLVVGDVEKLPYKPAVVVIAENKETYERFPEIEKGLVVWGEGGAHAKCRGMKAVREAPYLFFFGDMDTAGLEQLDRFRREGLAATSLFMDTRAFEKYRAFGISMHKSGTAIGSKDALDLPDLTKSERELYRNLCREGWTGPRRIEQENIPLEDVEAEVYRLIALRAIRNQK
jgi:hypothetical protein